MSNLILNTDSYKQSHFLQYPPRTQKVFSYIESRGGEYPETVFFGIQMFVKEYLLKPITAADIDEAEEVSTAHGLPFNRKGWECVLNEHGGFLPIKICAIPEGTVVPTHNVLVTVENSGGEDTAFLTCFIETALLRAIWYPTTVATVSYRIKQIIRKYLLETGDIAGLPFKLHDFGARGVSSKESAGIGGLAHLVNFMGTDTMEALMYARKYYNEPMAGYSIPAAEHSTITSWGKEHEKDAYENMLNNFASKGKIVAVVSDSYDIYNAVTNIWGGELKKKILESGATIVIRPDSGKPSEVVLEVAMRLKQVFGGKLNVKGFFVLNPAVRIIQGDGINEESIKEILETLKANQFSADNIAFGMGGALLQHMNRDTLKFAMKCSAVMIDYHYRDVFKNPVTDTGKQSKKGCLTLVKEDGKYRTVNYLLEPCTTGLLKCVYGNGKLYVDESLATIRQRSVS